MSTEYNLLDKATVMDDASSVNVNGDDDKDDNSLRAKNNEEFLAKASMTESYSEILNSPIAETNDLPVESNAPIVIPKRRPSSLSRHHSNQCKCLLYQIIIDYHVFIFRIFTIYWFVFVVWSQHHFPMGRYEWMMEIWHILLPII